VTAILVLGFLLGMRHALESDHVAAVATLVAQRLTFGRTLMQGAIWGVGHALTLFLAFSLVLFLEVMVPERFAAALEALVGLMLVALGVDVLVRLWRERVHFHVHRHHDGTLHLHAHAHEAESREEHDPRHHEHEHLHGFPLRALLVGMVHGLAGSAALILLTLNSTMSPALGLVYVALFGAGATAGMAFLSAAIAVPLRWSARSMTWLNRGLQATVGCATIAIGAMLVLERAGAVT